MLLLVFPQSLSSAVERLSPVFRHLPCALELLAARFFHSSNAGTIGRLCGFVLLSQFNLCWAHTETSLTDQDRLVTFPLHTDYAQSGEQRDQSIRKLISSGSPTVNLISSAACESVKKLKAQFIF
jgi:hypothetical protein